MVHLTAFQFLLVIIGVDVFGIITGVVWYKIRKEWFDEKDERIT
jgi:hypothetical protein